MGFCESCESSMAAMAAAATLAKVGFAANKVIGC